MKAFCILLGLTGVVASEVFTETDTKSVLKNAGVLENSLVEGRGKAKYALLMHFFYVVATKLFVLKIVYGAIFYALIIKGWHFVSWFIHFLKEKKQKPYVPYGPYGPSSYGHHVPQYGYDLSGHDHYGQDQYGQDQYGQDGYGPEYVSDSYSSFNKKRHDSKKLYDADGSFSVKT